MKNKKGFTLIEILAVVAILGILSLIAVPNVLKYLNESRKRAMITQENTILDAANLYITDYCSSTKLHDGMCPDSYENNEESSEKYICLSDLQNTSNSYAETVKYKGKECKGIIVYDGKNPKGKTYLYCGDDGNYDYITDSSLNPAMYSRCGIGSVDYKSEASSTWEDRVSMLQTAKGGLEQVVQISSRISELLNSCSNPTNSSDDKKLINDEIVQLIQGIDAIRTTTHFNNVSILSDSSTYKDYMIYDLSDSNLESISCTSYNSNYLKYAESYKRKMDLNIVSIDANILESGELAGFIECTDEDCVKTIVRNILTYMLQDANNAINATDLKREEYNIEYTTFFKALNHIAEISENSSYSTSSLKLDSTNLTTSSNATNAKTLITNLISNLG